jgi:hypothetical protein
VFRLEILTHEASSPQPEDPISPDENALADSHIDKLVAEFENKHLPLNEITLRRPSHVDIELARLASEKKFHKLNLKDMKQCWSEKPRFKTESEKK